MSQKYPTKLSVDNGVVIVLFSVKWRRALGATNAPYPVCSVGPLKWQEGDVQHCSAPAAVGLCTLIPHPKQDFKAWRLR